MLHRRSARQLAAKARSHRSKIPRIWHFRNRERKPCVRSGKPRQSGRQHGSRLSELAGFCLVFPGF